MLATNDDIWNVITNLPPYNAVILTVFMHDPLASNCSHVTDFHAGSQDSVSCQNFFLFRGHHLILLPSPFPPNHLIVQYHTTHCRITSKGRYTKNLRRQYWYITQRFLEHMVGIRKEILHCVVIFFGHYCRGAEGWCGQIQCVTFSEEWLTLIIMDIECTWHST